MNDSVSIFVAVVIIYVGFRWMLSGSQEQTNQQQRPTVRRQHRATPQMVERVRTVFPDIPVAAIVADLQRTGSVEVTVDNALRNGGLPLPQSASIPQTPVAENTTARATSTQKAANYTNLLQRYNIDAGNAQVVEPPKVWDASAEKRQEMLRKRKEFMVLQARKKLLESQSSAPAAVPASETAAAQTSPVASSSSVNDASDTSTDGFDHLSVEELNALSPEQRRRHLLEALERKNNA